MADDELGFEIRQIEPGDTLTGLSLGDAAFVALKNFLRRQARPYHNQDLAKTYGAFRSNEPARVIGYVTLVCGQIETEEDAGPAIEPETEYPYDHFPAVKIARLAVDRRYSGQRVHHARHRGEPRVGFADHVRGSSQGLNFQTVPYLRPVLWTAAVPLRRSGVSQ